MGYSPGEFEDRSGDEFYWEVGGGTIKLWASDEPTLLLVLDLIQAELVLSQFQLLVDMLREGPQ